MGGRGVSVVSDNEDNDCIQGLGTWRRLYWKSKIKSDDLKEQSWLRQMIK